MKISKQEIDSILLTNVTILFFDESLHPRQRLHLAPFLCVGIGDAILS